MENKIKKLFEVNLQIFILILSTFAFAFIIYEASGVKAQTQGEQYAGAGALPDAAYGATVPGSWPGGTPPQVACCALGKDGSTCQEVVASQCTNFCNSTCQPTTCDLTTSCKRGCCFDPGEGTCATNSPKGTCEANGGTWNDDDACNIAQCQLGCCVLGDNVQFVTSTRCSTVSSSMGLPVDFRASITSEVQCLAIADQQQKGSCIIQSLDGKSCQFTTKAECLSMTGVASNFHANYLCTNPDLNATCLRTENTTCVSSKDEVYFTDSCGNLANIYDASRINDDAYWNFIVPKNESCGAGDIEGNRDSASCGNCDYLRGSRCSLYEQGESPSSAEPDYGDNFCRSLDCPDTSYGMGDRRNGESWCVYDGAIGDGKDVVGSRHWRHYCIDGEEEVEPCGDLREDICVQTDTRIGTSLETFSSSSCRINRWRECLDYNKYIEEDSQKAEKYCKENSDCDWVHYDFTDEWKQDICLAKYPPGLDMRNPSAQMCQMASTTCTMIEVKGLDGWDCEVNCDCKSEAWTEKMNDWCTRIGDCGVKANIAGKVTDDGYSITGGRRLSQDYIDSWQEFATPIPGQHAEPGNISDLILNSQGLVGGAEGPEEGYVVESSYLASVMSGVVGAGGTLAVLGGIGTTELSIVGVWAAGGYANAAIGGLAGAIGGAFIAAALGLTPGASMIVSLIGGVVGVVVTIGYAVSGYGFWSAAAYGGFWGLAAAAVVAIIFSFMGIGDTREKKVTFSCYPYQAPRGGDDCEKCDQSPPGLGGEFKPCSKYRCESLGQTCKLINVDTPQQQCIDSNPNDVNSPIISPLRGYITSGYEYREITSNGFKITDNQGGCVPEYTPLRFGIATNEVSQCKFDVIHTTSYDSMASFFGDSNLFTINHTTSFALPGPGGVAANEMDGVISNGLMLSQTGDYNMYVRCEDLAGNSNVAEYNIRLCVKPGPDLSAPYVMNANPVSGSYIRFNTSEKDVTFYTNEPATCKWSKQESGYDSMENSMTCDYSIGTDINGYPCHAHLTNITGQSTYYIKCRDQPWLAGVNESARNTMATSYHYVISTSSQLRITGIQPVSGTNIVTGYEPITVNLIVTTSGGGGNVQCQYGFNGVDYVDVMQNTGSQFTYSFNQITRGTWRFYIQCSDAAENVAENSTQFTVRVDTNSPIVVRAFYSSGALKILTNENADCRYSTSPVNECSFRFDNATVMSNSGTEHTAEWNTDYTYYIKCKDTYGNGPDGCSIVVRAYNLI